SAMRNLDWQVGHWTTTRSFSRVLRLSDKEMSDVGGSVHRSLTHTVACGGMRAAPLRVKTSRRTTGGVSSMSEHEQAPAPEVGSTASPAEKKEPKVIKRYTNRKLYDTVESRYVTLDEIAQMIKGGAEVKIIDNRSKEDLTSVTLAQIIFEEEKKR